MVPPLKSLAARCSAVDMPNERKVHTRPIPKIGGLAIACGALIPILLWASLNEFGRALMTGAAIIVVFGFLDDILDLPYKAKFLAQIIAALIVIHFGHLHLNYLGNLAPDDYQLPAALAIPLSVFVIVGVTNAINLSDGLDGLAGGITLMTFICLGYLAYLGEHYFTLTLSVAVIGAIFGFLRFNTYPAVIFMGDTGSQLLGFLAICLSIYITQGNQPLSPLLPLIILGFPILDTLTVMTERIMKGRSPFKPDKNHFHHKLMRLGLFHTEAVFTIYVLQSLLITSAVVFRFHSELFWLIFYSLFSGLIILAFVILDRRHWTFPRTDLIDKVIKGRLKILKEKHIIIKICFRSIEYGLPLLLAISCLLLDNIPGYFAAIAGGLSLLILTCLLIRPSLSATSMRICLYFVVPFLIYLVESVVRDFPLGANRLYHMAFGVMVLFVVLTLKFTRRRKGFKTTPMDFLVLFIALLVPNIPDTRIQSLHMGMVAAQIIAFLFGFEVLIGELRGELKRQMIFAAIIFAIIPAKYLMM
jgi:UDP-GlcNAc:undecaprenyl-phosphate GlcNAc-1-phosphate transferase